MPAGRRDRHACGMSLSRPTIVCGLDGSSASAELARIAAGLADVLDARLELVHVLGAQPALPSLASAATTAGSGWATGGTSTDDGRDSELEALAMLDTICDAVGAATAGRHVVRYGDPARRLAIIAEQCDALLVVVGTQGDARAGDALLGSVSSRLAADAPCPVLVIAPGLEPHVRPETWRGRTLVSGFDGSPAGWGAARHAAGLADRLGGALSVVSVGAGAVRPARDIVRHLQDLGARRGDRHAIATALDVRHELRVGDPAWELEAVAAAITAPLIAVGSRGRGPWRDALLGSVARRLLKTARRPILILPAATLLPARTS
jgi:nucleotide-binding universal stress UspA family protein